MPVGAGVPVGLDVGAGEGGVDGSGDGCQLGTVVGTDVGGVVGTDVGTDVGTNVGPGVSYVGIDVGPAVGTDVGGLVWPLARPTAHHSSTASTRILPSPAYTARMGSQRPRAVAVLKTLAPRKIGQSLMQQCRHLDYNCNGIPELYY